jgi:hypothetical protein
MQGIEGALVEGRNRVLSKEKDVYSFNAWDSVQWTDEEISLALEKVKIQKQGAIPEQEHHKYNEDPAARWNSFYDNNKEKVCSITVLS